MAFELNFVVLKINSSYFLRCSMRKILIKYLIFFKFLRKKLGIYIYIIFFYIFLIKLLHIDFQNNLEIVQASSN